MYVYFSDIWAALQLNSYGVGQFERRHFWIFFFGLVAWRNVIERKKCFIILIFPALSRRIIHAANIWSVQSSSCNAFSKQCLHKRKIIRQGSYKRCLMSPGHGTISSVPISQSHPSVHTFITSFLMLSHPFFASHHLSPLRYQEENAYVELLCRKMDQETYMKVYDNYRLTCVDGEWKAFLISPSIQMKIVTYFQGVEVSCYHEKNN